jgi:hypothetical protein
MDKLNYSGKNKRHSHCDFQPFFCDEHWEVFDMSFSLGIGGVRRVGIFFNGKENDLAKLFINAFTCFCRTFNVFYAFVWSQLKKFFSSYYPTVITIDFSTSNYFKLHFGAQNYEHLKWDGGDYQMSEKLYS